ncbi:hypothetical protein LS77_006520 [Helicobacter bilis]|uniref:Uncharacterized protein n=1 Tax=Helicobacter bilis TaxID=37372 RepID=A0A6D2C8B7_9HELI|nr:hypothetical protein LS77_006520 [Helicobacter bilis]TLE05157.1 hypothetical protein LS76_006225 [Helicobacter bilis]
MELEKCCIFKVLHTIQFVYVMHLCGLHKQNISCQTVRVALWLSLEDKTIEKLKRKVREYNFYVETDDMNHDKYSVLNYVESGTTLNLFILNILMLLILLCSWIKNPHVILFWIFGFIKKEKLQNIFQIYLKIKSTSMLTLPIQSILKDNNVERDERR